MEQHEWEAGVAQKRAGMGRLADEVEGMLAEECKEVAITRLLQTRPVLLEQTQVMADTPDEVMADRLKVPVGRAAEIMAQYRGTPPEELFERTLAQLRAMPAEEVKASQLAMLRKVSSEGSMPPMPSELGAA